MRDPGAAQGPRLSSISDVGGTGWAAARPGRSASREEQVELCFFVRRQLVVAVLHGLDVQPHAQEPFFGVCLFVAGQPFPAAT